MMCGLSVPCHSVPACLFISALGSCLLLTSPCWLIISHHFLMQPTSPTDGREGERGGGRSRRQQLHISFTLLTMLLNTFHSTLRYMGRLESQLVLSYYFYKEIMKRKCYKKYHNILLFTHYIYFTISI